MTTGQSSDKLDICHINDSMPFGVVVAGAVSRSWIMSAMSKFLSLPCVRPREWKRIPNVLRHVYDKCVSSVQSQFPCSRISIDLELSGIAEQSPVNPERDLNLARWKVYKRHFLFDRVKTACKFVVVSAVGLSERDMHCHHAVRMRRTRTGRSI